MQPQDRYDSLIQYYAENHGLDPRLIKRQIEAESSFNPRAVSPAGAMGLMQFMPATWEEWGEGGDPFNPEESIKAGCRYMRYLYDRFPEIPDPDERYRFALAAYNAGIGNINKCLARAREMFGAPASFAEWERQGRRPGPWQEWELASRSLGLVTGPKSIETINYVEKILPKRRMTFDLGPRAVPQM